MPIPGPEEEEWLRTLKKVTVRICLGGLPQRRRDKPLFSKNWPEAWGAQPMKKAEQERLHAGPGNEGLLTALNALPRDVWMACALINQGMLDVASFVPCPQTYAQPWQSKKHGQKMCQHTRRRSTHSWLAIMLLHRVHCGSTLTNKNQMTCACSYCSFSSKKG